MICCDTSFLLALYVESDRFYPQANKIAARFKEPFSLTLLLELELHNGIRRTLAAGAISRQEHDAIFRQIESDESDGILRRCTLASTEHYARARELSKRYTTQLSCRSLDILHVAAAMLLKAGEFASFDDRQRRFADQAGLSLLPRQA